MRAGVLILSLLVAGSAAAQTSPSAAPPLLPPAQGTAIAAEVSGARAMQTVRLLSTNHRMRGSSGFRAAAEAIRDRLQAYGLEQETDEEDLSLRLANILKRLRPELDIYLLTDRDVEKVAGDHRADAVRRVFYQVEEPLELHLSILEGVQERFETPFFDNPSEGRLEADDIARAVLYAVSQPPHVDVNEILVRPTAQGQ